ncbi:MAG TPA: hypothetical protein VEI02_15220 [Planctomycetota bacterium]|nr:hypothetical protein [Planctomycetota bacterium]
MNRPLRTLGVAASLLAFAVVPAALVAWPAAGALMRARADAATLALDAQDADARVEEADARAAGDRDLAPRLLDAARRLRDGAPRVDAPGDRALYLARAAAAAGVSLVAAQEDDELLPASGGYAFPEVAATVEGSYAGLAAFVAALEDGPRCVSVESFKLRRCDAADGNLRLEAGLTFAKRVEAPDPFDGLPTLNGGPR